MKDSVKEKAYAKINISLDITGKRDDGYHDMVMVMQTVSICDDIKISLNDSGVIRSYSNLRFIPGDDRNLAVRAAKRYLEEIGEQVSGLRIDMHKDIPVGAGMGGGSSDAAAVLRGMNKLFDDRLSADELQKLAEDVGSDTAFCVKGGTALAEGRGEILTELPAFPDSIFVVCKPGFSISTPELFKKIDAAPLRRHPDTAGILDALDKGDLREICRRMYNVFEDVDDRRMRTVTEIKNRLMDFGTLGSIMTGTGSAVFGIFDDENKAQLAMESLKQDYRFCYIAKPVKKLM